MAGRRFVACAHDGAASAVSSGGLRFPDGCWEPRHRYTECGDHATDPQEMNNLAGDPEHAGIIEELSRRLRARVAEAKGRPKGLVQVRIRREFVDD